MSVASGNTQWTSIMECVSATGRYIKPLVVHQGTAPSQPFDHWFPPTQDCPNFYWGFSKKGWVTSEYGAKWFSEIFLPETKREGMKWRVLYIDAVQSHYTGEMQYEALQHQVKIIWLLPHTLHILQPLDQ